MADLTPVWADPLATLFCGDARQVLAGLPAESVQCCITSPPYWGLRDYKIPPLVWGGQAGCGHEWGTELSERKRGTDFGPNATAGNTKSIRAPTEVKQGQFCAKCGAWLGSLGLEPTPELYVQHIVEIFRAVRRVLRSDGICLINLGDSYYASGGAHKPEHANPGISNSWDRDGVPHWGQLGQPGHYLAPNGLKPLDLCGLPWRVALALQADGWYLRSDIIWSKPNPMPESVSGSRWERHKMKMGVKLAKQDSHPGSDSLPEGRHGLGTPIWEDCPGCPVCLPNDGLVLRHGSWRPTTSHEYIFMLTKSADYFADGLAVHERSTGQDGAAATFARETKDEVIPNQLFPQHRLDRKPMGDNGHRNKRTVWTINPQPVAFLHFATFPEKLVEPCLLAGTSERGACPKCGQAWVRVIKPSRKYAELLEKARNETWYASIKTDTTKSKSEQLQPPPSAVAHYETLGWRPACACNAGEAVPCLVLDCFAGSGTVGVVARQWGRKAILVELSEKYCQLAVKRLTGTQPALA